MDGITRVGRAFFAIALVALGVEHFIFDQFVTGRAPPWPEGVAGGTAWAWVAGGAFVAAGAAVLMRRHARAALLLASLLIFGWALLRHIPLAAADSLFGVRWTSAGKALTFTGGALAVAATLPPVRGTGRLARFANLDRPFTIAGRITLGTFLIITGVQHYIFTPFVATLVPAWIPGGGVFWTYAAGVMLLAGGVGLLVPQTTRLAALLSGMMVFSWFWIVHLPRTFDGISSAIALPEALAVAGIAFVLAGRSRSSDFDRTEAQAAGNARVAA